MKHYYNSSKVELKKVMQPENEETLLPVMLKDETFEERREKLFSLMGEKELDTLVIYGDLEHGSNFEYLTGFLPRFEEGLLVVHRKGKAYLLLGNENLKMAAHSRIEAELIHVPYFSLPNQPMDGDYGIKEPLRQAGIRAGIKIGVVGWKYFTSSTLDNSKLFDIPYYIMEGLMELAEDKASVINACGLFISPEYGVRTVNNANEIAHLEFGAALSGINILEAQNRVQPGMSEMELAQSYKSYGQKQSVISICATGERFIKANIYPSDKKIKVGDRMSLTVGYKGGLNSRAGYVVKNENELPDQEKQYLELLAKPYFAACAAWLVQIHIGMQGGELYNLVEDVFPKAKYNWFLNPGHLTSDDEWMSSPVYNGSKDILKSGMLLQLDIIPSIIGMGGTSCESGIALADDALKKEIRDKYPMVWARMEARLNYIRNVINIKVSNDVLPLSCITGYYRPFFLDKEKALTMVDA
ncbi:MAG: M24 family metallopeptidase [Anaerolineaceae bacterium]|nr:MAG: M24 family metallopeptidase [Anaerolineaceae bacterium]